MNKRVNIGSVSIFNMDCMDFMKTCSDNYFDLAIVDPPYGRNEDGGKIRNHGIVQKNGNILYSGANAYLKKTWDVVPDTEYFDELFRVSKNQIIFGMNYMPFALKGGVIVWDKLNDGASQSGAELAYNSLTNKVDVVRYMWRGMMQGKSIGSLFQNGNKKLNEKRIHPTQKPVILYEWILTQYAKKGFKIIDTHSGSGSLAIACNKHGYELSACEIDKDYFTDSCNWVECESRQLEMF